MEEQKDHILKQLEEDLKIFKDSILEVRDDIMVNEISQHPVFIAHQHEVSLGEIILDKDELATNWSINASYLEEFIEKKVINPEKKDEFIKAFKDPMEFLCVFVIVEEGANYVFIPYSAL